MTTKPSWRTTYLGVGDGVDAKNVSWGAVFAGIVTTIAVLIAFSLLGTAIGLGVTKLTADQPFQGVGTALAIWAILTLAFLSGGLLTLGLASLSSQRTGRDRTTRAGAVSTESSRQNGN
jgi:hypothetical protein